MPKKTVICVDVYGKKYEVAVSSLAWRPSAYAIVIKNNKLLVSPQFNGYDLPGGGVNLGEAPQEASVRETKEETGIDVRNPQLVEVISSFYKPYKPKPGEPEAVQSIMMYFKCEFVGGELSMDGFDEYEQEYARMPEWLPVEKLDEIEIASSVDWRVYVRKVADENSRH